MLATLVILVTLAIGASIVIAIYDRLSGRSFIRDGLDKIRLGRRSVAEWDAHWKANPNRSDIIVCLTTLPSRLPLIDATLKSLMAQHRAPAKIRLHVPKESRRENIPYDVPPWLQTLDSVEVITTQEDWGPATKLIPALYECRPHQRLLVVDDDKLYAPDLVDDLDHKSRTHPELIVASSGWCVPADLEDRAVTTLNTLKGLAPARLKSTHVPAPTRVDVVQGHSGYVVRPEQIDVDALVKGYESAPEDVFFVDDVWISAHALAEKWVFPADRFCFVSWLRLRVYDGTSLEAYAARSDAREHPNTIAIRYLRDRWMATGDPTPRRRV